MSVIRVRAMNLSGQTRCRNLQYQDQENEVMVRCLLLYLLEIEWNWKAHHDVKWTAL